MLMATFMKENGKMIKPTEKEFIIMQMVLIITAIGKTINSTDLVQRDGLMVLFIKASTMKERRMVEENLHLLMDPFTKETFK